MAARIIAIALSLFAGSVFAQTPAQLADWCYGESTDEETVRGCDAEIASGRARNLGDAYGARGFAYNRLRQYDKAMADHDKAIELNPSTAMLYNNRGWTLNNMGRHEQALRDLDHALRLNGKLPEAYNNRGVAYQRMGQFDRAIAEYDAALRLKPGHALYLRNRAQAVEAKEKAGR